MTNLAPELERAADAGKVVRVSCDVVCGVVGVFEAEEKGSGGVEPIATTHLTRLVLALFAVNLVALSLRCMNHTGARAAQRHKCVSGDAHITNVERHTHV
jgi:hypothetical protein